MEIPHAPHLDDGGGAGGRYLARASTESLARRHCTSSSMVDECRALLIAGALATACSPASNAAPTGDGSNRGDATAPEADGGQLTDSSASTTDGPSADDGHGQGGADGSAAVAAQNANNYDGARPTTVSFDASWKFHLGDVTGAQATTFDDSSWTAARRAARLEHLAAVQPKLARQERAAGTSTAASGGTERPSRLPASSHGATGLRPVRRRLHGQHRVHERNADLRTPVWLHLLRV